VTLATSSGSRGPRIGGGLESGGGAVASGIFEESVQRVTLAVGEGEAAPPPPPLPLQQEPEEEEQHMVEEEQIVEDIVREMMRNEGSVRQRWVTYSDVGILGTGADSKDLQAVCPIQVHYGSRVLMIKNSKKLQLKKKLVFFDQKLQFTYP
jgi:hypothetical protein